MSARSARNIFRENDCFTKMTITSDLEELERKTSPFWKPKRILYYLGYLKVAITLYPNNGSQYNLGENIFKFMVSNFFSIFSFKLYKTKADGIFFQNQSPTTRMHPTL